MIRIVLVPLDGSPFAEHALPVALSIARRKGALIELLRVHAPVTGVHMDYQLIGSVDTSFVNELKTRERRYLEEVGNRLQKIVPNVLSVTSVREGAVAPAIRETASKEEIDLVVMTTHGRGAASRFWLGSVADELLRDLSVPLLLVRPGDAPADLNQEFRCRHILVPLDGSEFAEQILEPALELGSALGADYRLLRVLRPAPVRGYGLEGALPEGWYARLEEEQEQARQAARRYLETVAERLRTRGASVTTKVVESDQPAVAILAEAVSPQTGMVAIQTHGRHGVSRLMLGSVADKVIRGASVPVLVRRPKSPGTTPEGPRSF